MKMTKHNKESSTMKSMHNWRLAVRSHRLIKVACAAAVAASLGSGSLWADAGSASINVSVTVPAVDTIQVAVAGDTPSSSVSVSPTVGGDPIHLVLTATSNDRKGYSVTVSADNAHVSASKFVLTGNTTGNNETLACLLQKNLNNNGTISLSGGDYTIMNSSDKSGANGDTQDLYLSIPTSGTGYTGNASVAADTYSGDLTVTIAAK